MVLLAKSFQNLLERKDLTVPNLREIIQRMFLGASTRNLRIEPVQRIAHRRGILWLPRNREDLL